MTSKEKKNLIVHEVIKPEFKNAGYQSLGQTYYCLQDDCYIAVKLQNSQFNSENTGYTFRFHIKAFPKETSLETLKNWSAWSDSIHEDVLLPDCGNLHPYRNGKGYHINIRKYDIPQDMENICNCISSDLRDHILPQISEIKNLTAWEVCKKEWLNRWNDPKILLMNYFNAVQLFTADPDNLPQLRDAQRRFGLSAEVIKENYALYQKIKEASVCPEEDNWEFILLSLQEY